MYQYMFPPNYIQKQGYMFNTQTLQLVDIHVYPYIYAHGLHTHLQSIMARNGLAVAGRWQCINGNSMIRLVQISFIKFWDEPFTCCTCYCNNQVFRRFNRLKGNKTDPRLRIPKENATHSWWRRLFIFLYHTPKLSSKSVSLLTTQTSQIDEWHGAQDMNSILSYIRVPLKALLCVPHTSYFKLPLD